MNSAADTNGAGGAEVTPLIELRDVVFSYAEHTVVDGVSLQVDRGELVALLGPNGCGKTTIMRLINGLELADAGAYLFDGHVIDAAFLKDSAAAQRFHQRVGFVFQNADAQLFCAGGDGHDLVLVEIEIRRFPVVDEYGTADILPLAAG